jgi:hypothetical protein
MSVFLQGFLGISCGNAFSLQRMMKFLIVNTWALLFAFWNGARLIREILLIQTVHG